MFQGNVAKKERISINVCGVGSYFAKFAVLLLKKVVEILINNAAPNIIKIS